MVNVARPGVSQEVDEIGPTNELKVSAQNMKVIVTQTDKLADENE